MNPVEFIQFEIQSQIPIFHELFVTFCTTAACYLLRFYLKKINENNIDECTEVNKITKNRQTWLATDCKYLKMFSIELLTVVVGLLSIFFGTFFIKTACLQA